RRLKKRVASRKTRLPRMSAPTRRFMDAYHRGLDGKWAAWAGKYHGHRVLPESLMIELEAAMAK
ncbi:hypothetical protein R3P38DRAFT_2413892, partial [Favolaschia claudopus]